MAWTQDQMAARAAKELQDGYYVNLGIGIPTLVAKPRARHRSLAAERNGMLGIGPFPTEETSTPTSSTPASRPSPPARLVDLRQPRQFRDDPRRQGQPVHPRRHAGQRKGDLANWMIPGKMVKGMGGRWTWWAVCAAWWF